jgi:hypothetical protein
MPFSSSSFVSIWCRLRRAVEWLLLVCGVLLLHLRKVGPSRRSVPVPLLSEEAARRRGSLLAWTLFPVVLMGAMIVDGGDGSASVLSEGDGSSRATVSRYVNWMTDDVERDRAVSYRLGCRGGERGESGVVVLAFGRQIADGGTRGFAGPGVVRSYAQIAAVVAAYRDGLAACGAGDVLLAVTTSNYDFYDVEEAAGFGGRWRELVESIGPVGGVRIIGGTDLEPGWGGLAASRAWVDAYKSTGLVLYANASADGCPLSGVGGGCANGWDTSSLAELVWGSRGVAVPQVYRRDGAQARQWKVLAEVWARTGGAPVFGGVMTQQRACRQVVDPNCPQLSQPHDVARNQLQVLLGSLADVPVGTDVGWG